MAPESSCGHLTLNKLENGHCERFQLARPASFLHFDVV
jgi:hypothetical protein